MQQTHATDPCNIPCNVSSNAPCNHVPLDCAPQRPTYRAPCHHTLRQTARCPVQHAVAGTRGSMRVTRLHAKECNHGDLAIRDDFVEVLGLGELAACERCERSGEDARRAGVASAVANLDGSVIGIAERACLALPL